MHTRCSHCKAVFLVTMKDLATAQGKLRCGECASVFNAMDYLSISVLEQHDPSKRALFQSLDKVTSNNKKQVSSTTDKRQQHVQSTERGKNSTLWKILSIVILTGVLALQIWGTKDTWQSPLKSPSEIKMTSRKVFSHPYEPNALIITGLIENTSKHAQPYPFLETKLLDTNKQVVALRRFKPGEYLEQYIPEQLIKQSEITSIRLKIQDPPNSKAKYFQFSFL